MMNSGRSELLIALESEPHLQFRKKLIKTGTFLKLSIPGLPFSRTRSFNEGFFPSGFILLLQGQTNHGLQQLNMPIPHCIVQLYSEPVTCKAHKFSFILC